MESIWRNEALAAGLIFLRCLDSMQKIVKNLNLGKRK